MLTNNPSPSLAPSSLDDAALMRKLVALRGRERATLVDFLRHLAELDARKLYLAQGCSSLYAYCRDVLGLSEGGAFRRYTTARLMMRFPVIGDLILQGRISLVRVALLKDVLTEQNHQDLLERATRGTERDVEVLVASLNPKPDVTDSIRRVPARAAAPSFTPSPASTPTDAAASQPPAAAPFVTSPRASTESTPSPATLFAPVRTSRMEVEPTSATAFSLRMRIGPECLAELEAVRAALSHKIPDGNFEAILRECFRITLEVVQRRRAGARRHKGSDSESTSSVVPTPEASPKVRSQDVVGEQDVGDPSAVGSSASKTSAAETTAAHPDASASSAAETAATSNPSTPAVKKSSRYIAADVRRAVWKRDAGRCAFVSADGRRCDSVYQLEVHHKDPHARGGPPTVENLSLRCRQHNLHEAEVAFGTDFMRSLPIWRCEESATPSLYTC